jgi:hypothetical protein
MNTIEFNAILSGASTRADQSLSLRLATSELEAREKTVFFELLNQPISCRFTPSTEPGAVTVEVKREVDRKPPSVRLRGCLYRLWEWERSQGRCDLEFDQFYGDAMERLIQMVKDKLPEPKF